MYMLNRKNTIPKPILLSTYVKNLETSKFRRRCRKLIECLYTLVARDDLSFRASGVVVDTLSLLLPPSHCVTVYTMQKTDKIY